MSQPKFCPKCGQPLKENEKFCGACGQPIQSEAQPSAIPTDAQVNNGNTAAKKLPVSPAILAIAAAAIIVVIVAIVIIVNITKYQKIDAKELFKIEFKGINGSGTCTAVLNCDIYALSKAGVEDIDKLDEYSSYDSLFSFDDEDDDESVLSKSDSKYSKYFSTDKKELLKAYDKADNKSDAEDMRDTLLKVNKKKGEFELKLDLSDSKNLSNGDKIKCTVEYDEEEYKDANIKLTNTEFEVDVKGLTEGEKVDLFKGFEVKFDGMDGYGEADFPEKSADYEFIRYYNTTSNYDLSNGDKFVINAYISSDVEDAGYVDPDDSSSAYYFTYNKKTYIVDKSSEDKEFEVSGLKEAAEADVFEGVKLETSGAFPYLYVTGINKDDVPEYIQDNVSYSLDDYSKAYKVGDTVTVKAYVYESYLREEGYKPTGTKDSDGYYIKQIELTDADYSHFYTTDSSVSDAEKLDDLIADDVAEFKSDAIDRSYISGLSLDDPIKSVTSIDPVSFYIAVANGFDNGSLEKYDTKIEMFRVYKVTAVLDDDKKSSKTFYVAFEIVNPYIDAEGNAAAGSDYFSYVCAENGTKLVEALTTACESYDLKLSKLGEGSANTDSSSTADSKADSSSTADSKDDSSSATDSKDDSSSEAA